MAADKKLMILHGEIRTPPMSKEARLEAGYLLRKLQQGETLSLPHLRPMPDIGRRCHELSKRLKITSHLQIGSFLENEPILGELNFR